MSAINSWDEKYGIIPAVRSHTVTVHDGAYDQRYTIDPDDEVLLVILARFMALVSLWIHLYRRINDFYRQVEELFDRLAEFDPSSFPVSGLTPVLEASFAKLLRSEGLTLSHHEIHSLLRAILQHVRQLTHRLPTQAEALRGLTRYNLFCVYRI